jgi:hypothetical protein
MTDHGVQAYITRHEAKICLAHTLPIYKICVPEMWQQFKNHIFVQSYHDKSSSIMPLAEWRSGHRSHLTTEDPGSNPAMV